MSDGKAVLVPCRVPWRISSSESGVTLTHSESDESPSCSVECVCARLEDVVETKVRIVEIAFEGCFFARVGWHDDAKCVEELGYKVQTDLPATDSEMAEILAAGNARWLSNGYCPDSGFYLAAASAWAEETTRLLPDWWRSPLQHYVVDGRDGYVEVSRVATAGVNGCVVEGVWHWLSEVNQSSPRTGLWIERKNT